MRNDGGDTGALGPTVSVGLPVRNGERYLAEAIESILGQTCAGLELIVSDNGSTDGTDQICASFAARDPRVRHHRSPVDRGAAWNFNRVLELASGRYFKWAAHDDVLAPSYLERCVEVLERDPAVVLCHTATAVIDEAGAAVGELDLGIAGADSPDAARRFRALVRGDRLCFDIFGLVRAEALRQTSGLGSWPGSDRALRAQLGLRGRFHVVPETLFYSRDHAERSVRALPAHHLRTAWFDPGRRRRALLPHWRILAAYAGVAAGSSLPLSRRLRCLAALGGWLSVESNWARLLADPVVAVFPQSWTVFARLARSRERWLEAARPPAAPRG